MGSIEEVKRKYFDSKNSKKILGHGSYGVVFSIEINNQILAIKRIQLVDVVQEITESDRKKLVDRISKDPKRQKLDDTDREILALKVLDHPNILKLYSTFTDDNFKYLVLEYCEATITHYCNGDYKGPMPVDWEALHQMASGLLHVHQEGFVHRDIKADNVLICKINDEKVQLKISDFGFCKPTNESGSFSLRSGKKCTRIFAAPELLNGEGGEEVRGNIYSDIFSLGCLFYTHLTKGKHPFMRRSENRYDILNNIINGNYSLEELDRSKEFAKEIIAGMIKPVDRTKLEQVMQMLQDQKAET